MVETIIKTTISVVISGLLGYCINAIKGYKKKLEEKKNSEKSLLEEIKKIKESQLLDMRSDLSSKFYVYDAMDEVEDYLATSFQEKCERYFEMDGNHWIHKLYEKSFQWKIKVTGYLK